MATTLSFTFDASTAPFSVQLPIVGIDVCANVVWGDGNTSNNVSATTIYTYTTTSTSYTATFTFISGIITGFGTDTADPPVPWTGGYRLLSVSTTNNLTWGLGNYVTNFGYAFKYCKFLTSVPANIPQSVTSIRGMFLGCLSFNDSNISNWNVENVTDTREMFTTTPLFNQNIGSWNVGRVTSFFSMFSGSGFNNGGSPTINNWNTSNVTDISEMFVGGIFNQPIGNWNVSKVTNMYRTFAFNGTFNQDIGKWDVGNVAAMIQTFYSAAGFNNGGSNSIQTWNTSNVTHMGAMFHSCAIFNQPIGQWNTSKVTSMGQMFYSCFQFTQFICCWNVSSVATFNDMFGNDGNFLTKYASYTGIGVTPTADFFNASLGFTYTLPAAYTLTIPFSYVSNVIDASFNWGDGTTQRITNAPFTHTYTNAGTYDIVCNINSGGNNITQIGTGFELTGNQYLVGIYSAYATTNWGTGSNLSVISLYNNTSTSYLESVPLSLPTSVTSLTQMFRGAKIFNQDLKSWNVSNITNMISMFEGAIVFNKNLSTWSINGANMSRMFRGADAFNNGGSALTWGLNMATNMSQMFYDAITFNQDISTWNTYGVSTMAEMFKNATAFNKLTIRKWDVRNTVILTDMFYNATAFQAFYPISPGYDGTDGSTIDTPLWTFFNLQRFPCFMEDTKILCLKNNKEVYRPIQELRKGDLVKTISNGYLPIYKIGTSELPNPGHDHRIPNRLYKCSTEKYPELFEDLYITGCHSILVPFLTDEEWDNTKQLLGDIFITDNHFRLMACLDENAEPYNKDAYINIYHIALENSNYYMNYGIYANGLLVETCSKRYLTELSNMRIIGEESYMKDDAFANKMDVNFTIPVI